jgi:hypothetical protein
VAGGQTEGARTILDTPGVGETIPFMGVTIRRHEIIDGLQRQYLPRDSRISKYQEADRGRVTTSREDVIEL